MRTWQDVMLKRFDKKWIERQYTSMDVYNLVEDICELEEKVEKYRDRYQIELDVHTNVAIENDKLRELLKDYADNVDWYKNELAGSWFRIARDAEEILGERE